MGSRNPEELEIRCPRLGGTVPFRYCLAPGEPAACSKILDCWWEIFDVASYLQAHLSEEEFSRVLENRRPPNRMTTILGLVERFTKGEKDDSEEKGT